MGVLESRPWADQRVENVSLDHGSSGGRFIIASLSLFRLLYVGKNGYYEDVDVGMVEVLFASFALEAIVSFPAKIRWLQQELLTVSFS